MLLDVPLSRPESFEPVVNDSGRVCGFIVAVLHFSAPTNPVPVVLEAICVNFLCHVQGQAAQGQLIAFIIMISRQIYRACLKSADQSFAKCVYSSQFSSFSCFKWYFYTGLQNLLHKPFLDSPFDHSVCNASNVYTIRCEFVNCRKLCSVWGNGSQLIRDQYGSCSTDRNACDPRIDCKLMGHSHVMP